MSLAKQLWIYELVQLLKMAEYARDCVHHASSLRRRGQPTWAAPGGRMLAAADGASVLVSTCAGRFDSICVMVALRADHRGSKRWLISAVMAASCSSICSCGCKHSVRPGELMWYQGKSVYIVSGQIRLYISGQNSLGGISTTQSMW